MVRGSTPAEVLSPEVFREVMRTAHETVQDAQATRRHAEFIRHDSARVRMLSRVLVRQLKTSQLPVSTSVSGGAAVGSPDPGGPRPAD